MSLGHTYRGRRRGSCQAAVSDERAPTAEIGDVSRVDVALRPKTAVRPLDTAREVSAAETPKRRPLAVVQAAELARPTPGDKTGPASRLAESQSRAGLSMKAGFGGGVAPASREVPCEPYAKLSAPVRAHAEQLEQTLASSAPDFAPIDHRIDPSAVRRSWVQDRRLALSDLAQTPRFARLPEAEQRTLLDRAAKDGRWLTSNVSPLIAQGHWGQLGDKTHEALLDRFARSPDGGDKLAAMLGSSRGQALSGGERNQLARIFAASSAFTGDESINRILWSDLGGQPLLRSRSPSGGRLIDELERFAQSTLDPRVSAAMPKFPGIVDAKTQAFLDEGRKRDALSDLLTEVAQPMVAVGQSNRGTCTVTSHLHNLARRTPAEYARVATDLATTGQSRLSSGTTVHVPADAFAPDSSARSLTERLTQAAMMQAARPEDTYLNRHPGPDRRLGTPDDGTISKTGRIPDGFTGANRTGLIDSESVRALEALHGRDYQARASSVFELFGKRVWGESLDELAQHKLAQGSPVFASLKWGKGAHQLEVVAVENGRVLLRNPWGGNASASALAAPQPVPTSEGMPPSRAIVDPRTGLESVSVEDFRAYGYSVIAAGR